MESIAVETHGSLGCKVMADDRFRVCCVQVPSRIQYFLFVDSHSHALTKMFNPGGYHKFQPEDAGSLQTLVEPQWNAPFRLWAAWTSCIRIRNRCRFSSAIEYSTVTVTARRHPEGVLRNHAAG